MSICVEGTLFVKKVKGRHGFFCIGDLITDVGEFKVKDPLIEQFEEGQYKGRFWIAQIYPSSYFAFGRAIIEIRAKLSDVQVNDEDDLPTDDKPQEPDPADESTSTSAQSDPASENLSSSPSKKVAKEATENLSDETLGDKDLFGDELWALIEKKHALKLDPTIDDRLRLRKQSYRLGKLGYDFDAKTQTWSFITH